MQETQVWCESKDRADWPAGTSAGWRKRKYKGRGVNTTSDWRGFDHGDAKSSVFKFYCAVNR